MLTAARWLRGWLAGWVGGQQVIIVVRWSLTKKIVNVLNNFWHNFSANINERSMSGTRDTEMAVGCWQSQFNHFNPYGDIHMFRSVTYLVSQFLSALVLCGWKVWTLREGRFLGLPGVQKDPDTLKHYKAVYLVVTVMKEGHNFWTHMWIVVQKISEVKPKESGFWT